MGDLAPIVLGTFVWHRRGTAQLNRSPRVRNDLKNVKIETQTPGEYKQPNQILVYVIYVGRYGLQYQPVEAIGDGMRVQLHCDGVGKSVVRYQGFS